MMGSIEHLIGAPEQYCFSKLQLWQWILEFEIRVMVFAFQTLSSPVVGWGSVQNEKTATGIANTSKYPDRTTVDLGQSSPRGSICSRAFLAVAESAVGRRGVSISHHYTWVAWSDAERTSTHGFLKNMNASTGCWLSMAEVIIQYWVSYNKHSLNLFVWIIAADSQLTLTTQH